MKNISFLSENFQILEVKLPIYLNRCVFVMLNQQKEENDHRNTCSFIINLCQSYPYVAKLGSNLRL